MKETNPGRGAVEAPIVVKVPTELKGMAEEFESLVATVQAKMRAAAGGRAVDCGEAERAIRDGTAAVERAGCRAYLQALDVDSPRVRIGGKAFTRIGHFPGTYYTSVGEVVIERALYRELGVRNGKTVDAISLRAGVVGHGWLPATAQAMAQLVQQGTSREAIVSAREMGRLPYARASFDRVTHDLGKHWLAEHADIEDDLIQEMPIPRGTRMVSVALDRTSVPIEEAVKQSRGRPRKNAPKVVRAFRMAYCGTVTLHNAQGDNLHTIRYGCMPDSDPELLCTAMANDVYRLMQRRRNIRLVLLGDGAPEIWALLERSMPPEVFGPRALLIDFYHLIEKLAAAAKLMFGQVGCHAARNRWVKALRKRNSAAQEILEELRDSGFEHTCVDQAQPVHDAITYIENHAHRMLYASARRQHFPIGSGNVEATCKTLVGLRMKRTGSRWKQPTGEHIIKLRALALSDRWEPAMHKLHAKRRTAVRKAA